MACFQPQEFGGYESLAYQLDANAVAHLTDVAKAITDSSATLLDARPKARFDGIAPEPRKGLKGGHMPGAVSMPITDLLAVGENDVKRLKPVAELQKYFADKGVQTNDAVITTCGSGVTAAIISLALVIAGHVPGRLYDGSWSEWGAATDTAVETS